MKDTSPAPRGAADDALGDLGDLEAFSSALRDLVDPRRDRDETWRHHYGGTPTDDDLAALEELANMIGTAAEPAAAHDTDPLAEAAPAATAGTDGSVGA